ncbi:glycoside hydrolase family 5 protein [Rhizobium rhododendri]
MNMVSDRFDPSSPQSAPPRASVNISRRQMLGGLTAAALAPGSIGAARSAVSVNRLTHFKRGFNLPGVADTSADQARLPSANVLAALKKLGFEAVRLPVDPGQLLKSGADRRAFLRGLETAFAVIEASGLRIMIDMHPSGTISDVLKSDYRSGGKLVDSAWRELLPLAAMSNPESTLIEVLNEPQLPASQWPELRQKLIDAIRSKLSSHTLIWSSANYQTIEETVGDTGPDDENAIAAVHFYYPMIFTHQGETWTNDGLSKIRNFPFPSTKGMSSIDQLRSAMEREGQADVVEMIDRETSVTWDRSRIIDEFSKLKEWSRKTGWPVIINEFGVLRWSAPPNDRALWLQTVRSVAEANDFGWTHWDMDQAFGFMSDRRDAKSIDMQIVKALTGGRR